MIKPLNVGKESFDLPPSLGGMRVKALLTCVKMWSALLSLLLQNSQDRGRGRGAGGRAVELIVRTVGGILAGSGTRGTSV